jgi:nitrite reductase/ring-hydroxylating ferredoxin subunit
MEQPMHDSDQRTTAPDGRPESEQPAWRQDFPIDVPQDHYVARRDFTKFLGLTSLGFVAGQFWILLRSWLRRRQDPPAAQAIAALGEIPIGGVKTFHYPGPDDACLLLRLDDETYVAYNQKCTHLSCAVVPRLDAGQLACPCHKGSFECRTGRPVAGPPRRPLTRITLEIRGQTIFATAVELRTV